MIDALIGGVLVGISTLPFSIHVRARARKIVNMDLRSTLPRTCTRVREAWGTVGQPVGKQSIESSACIQKRWHNYAAMPSGTPKATVNRLFSGWALQAVTTG